MVTFTTAIKKFDEKGEKTGWSFICIDADTAALLNPGIKKGYRVKGFLDTTAIEQAAILPMGDGSFILPINGELRKKIKKGKGATVQAKLSLDTSQVSIDSDFLTCLDDEPVARAYFYKLPPSHRNYYNKWISSAKSELTKAKRIALALSALAKGMHYGEMIRAQKGG